MQQDWFLLNDDLTNNLSEIKQLKLKMAGQNRLLYDFSMINPDLSPPRFILDKLVENSIKASNHKYSASKGIKKIREAFAYKYERRFNVKLDPANICACFGTKDAITQTLMACLAPNQNVLVAAPTYVAYNSSIKYCRLNPYYFEISPDQNQTLQNIKSALSQHPIHAIILNFPNNPTGLCVDRDFYKKLSQICDQILVINDFVYGEMGFKQTPFSALAVPELNAVETYSLSKAYSVPGWRVAGLLGNPRVVEKVSRLKSHLDYGLFTPLQIAASAALTANDDLVKANLEIYKRRALKLSEGLKRLGWSCEMPEAGACLWTTIPQKITLNSYQYALKLLDDLGIIALPGEVFGASYHRQMRFALVLSEEQINEVLEKLKEHSNL